MNEHLFTNFWYKKSQFDGSRKKHHRFTKTSLVRLKPEHIVVKGIKFLMKQAILVKDWTLPWLVDFGIVTPYEKCLQVEINLQQKSVFLQQKVNTFSYKIDMIKIFRCFFKQNKKKE